MWDRATYEVQAEVVVRGWQMDQGGRIWDVNSNGNGTQMSVSVDAPMLMLKQDMLINKVKLSQTSEEGTLTTLTLGINPTGKSPFPTQAPQPAKAGVDKTYPPDAGGTPLAGGAPIGQGGIGHA
jgi:hypothetical protein